jgi:hypothetical protein
MTALFRAKQLNIYLAAGSNGHPSPAIWGGWRLLTGHKAGQQKGLQPSGFTGWEGGRARGLHYRWTEIRRKAPSR